MRTLEDCIEHADELAKEVVNAWGASSPRGEGWEALFEAMNRYTGASDIANRARTNNMLKESEAAREDLTRQVFAATYIKYIDSGGHIPYATVQLVKEATSERFERTIVVEDRDDNEFKFQVTVNDVRRTGSDGLLGGDAIPAGYFRPWPTQALFHSLIDATSHAENIHAGSRLDGFEPV